MKRLNPHPASYAELFFGLIAAVLLVALIAHVSGCTSAPVAPQGVAAPVAIPSPSNAVLVPANAQGEALVTGWSPAYSAFIQASVPATLLAYPPESVCPKYKSLSDAGKRTFWADWLQSTASPESGFDRTQMFYEGGISSLDPVTGLHNVSEGLLQISYGDSECRGIFDYAKDKAAYLDDYSRAKLRPNKNTASLHPERTILDAQKNLACGLAILNKLLAGHPERAFQPTAGKYWSSVRDGKVKAYFDAHFSGLGCL